MTSPAPSVAVVDDELAVRTALRRLLQLAQFDVTTFDSGEAFLDSLAAVHPACVLLDLHLVGLSGIETLQQLRSRKLAIPVICITASDELQLDQAVVNAGAARLLRKPFSSDELTQAIGVVLAA